MKILVTGGTGFIGSRLVWALRSQEGHDVTVMTRQTSELFIGSRFLQHDFLAPLDSLHKELRDTEVVIHAGAETSGGFSVKDPVKSVRASVVGTYNLLEAASEFRKLQRFVYVSTGEVLGHLDAPAVADESAPLRPSNPYSAAKAAAEELCRVWGQWKSIPICIVRPMNVFGPGQKFPRFIPTVMSSLLTLPPVPLELEVHASGLAQGWGSRNWIQVMDCVDYLVHVAVRGTPGETYHIVGPELNNHEVVQALAEGAERLDVSIRGIRPPVSHDLRYAAVDTKLGIKEQITKEVVIGQLRSTAEWYRENRKCQSL